MARLILSLDGQVLAEYNMSKERYTIGRLPDNDVRIDNAAVSGHHSLIINILNDSFLEDLNSTNGTYVNGKLIKKHALQNGDVITVGHHQLKFGDDEVAEADQDEFEKTMVIHPSSQSDDVIRDVHEAVDEVAAELPAGKPIPMPGDDDHTSTVAPEAAPTTALPKARIQVLSGQFAGREMSANNKRYAVTILALGHKEQISISAKKFAAIERARELVVFGGSVEEKMDLVLQNYLALEQCLLGMALENSVFTGSCQE